jgi:hypothetical protein
MLSFNQLQCNKRRNTRDQSRVTNSSHFSAFRIVSVAVIPNSRIAKHETENVYVVAAYFKTLPQHLHGGLRKTTKIIGQNSRYADWNSNPEPPTCEVSVIFNEPRCCQLLRNKQDRQCTYNIIFRRSRVNTVAVEKQHVLRILCVCV